MSPSYQSPNPFDSRQARLDHLKAGRWFDRQAADLQGALADAGRVVRFERGQWIHSEGDASAGLWAVFSGSVRMEISVTSNRDQLLNIVGPGSMFGQSLGAEPGRRLVTARAAEAAQVFLVSSAALQTIARDHPTLWRSLSELLYGQLDQALRLAAESLALVPRARIAARLLGMAQSQDDPDAALRLTQADLAEMAGLSRKAVNGHMQALERQGAVRLGYGGIRILDRDRLEFLKQGLA